MTEQYMLDTNTVRQVVSRRNVNALRQVTRIPPSRICVSAITYGESLFGLRRRPEATRLALINEQFYVEVQVLPFTDATAITYGDLRAKLEAGGTPLGPLDMLIAAHALSISATLVSADRAFRFVPNLRVEDWTA